MMDIRNHFLSILLFGLLGFVGLKSSFAQNCNNPLTTNFNTNNGQDGIMFSISAKKNIVIDSFANNYANGTISQILVYYKWGLATGYITTASAWTLLGTVNGITSAGQNNPTMIPLNLNFAVPKYQTVSFYITTNGGNNPICRYTNGQGVCDSLDGNPDIIFYEGYGKDYPFAASFSPRQFNGIVYYHCVSNPTYSIVGPLNFCNTYVGQQATYKINPAISGVGITWNVPSGMTIVSGQGTDSIVVQFTNTNPSGTICAALVGCDTIGEICNTVYANPGVADAGNDTNICQTSYQLQGNAGAGYWEVLYGGTGVFTDSSQFNTNVSGLSLGPNYLKWNVGGYGCSYVSDTVMINVFPSITADFAFTDVCDGLATSLVDLSFTTGGGNVASWDWDVENDGNFDYDSNNIQHQYATYGSYTVKLRVASNDGCVDSVTNVIQIFPNPEASFTYVSKCEGQTISFTNTTSLAYGTLTNWIWNFSDGTPTTNAQSPTHIFANDGNYPVNLLALTAEGCVDDTTISVLVYRLPEPNFGIPNDCQQDIFTCTDSTEVFNGDYLVSWVWNFADGTPLDLNQNTIHYFPSAGLYNVTLTVISDKACTNAISLPVEVYPTPVAEFYTIGICEGEIVKFRDTSTVSGIFDSEIVQWDWNLGNGKLISKQHTINEYTKAGPYTITQEVFTNYGCHNLMEREIMIRPAPDAHMLIHNDEVCAGNEIKFTDETFFDHTYDVLGVTSWKWNFGDETTSSINRPKHTYEIGGNYLVKLVVETSYGCTDTTTKTAIIFHNPVAKYSLANNEGCEPLCVTFVDESYIPSSSDGFRSVWYFGDGDSLTGLNMTRCYSADTTGLTLVYIPSLKVISDHDCEANFSSNEKVIVYPNPEAIFTARKIQISVLDSVMYFTNLSEGASRWLWDFGDSVYSELAQPETHSYSVAGVYEPSLTAWSEYGCLDSFSLKIQVDAHQTIFLPNSFTPDNDGLNEFYQVMGEDLEYVRLTIFDRWGNLIFEGENDQAKWDGRKKGVISPIGVYSYNVLYKHTGQTKKRVNGMFVIAKNETGQ